MQAETKQLLKTFAPAALATEPSAGLSETYRFFDTTRVVDALEGDGWMVVEARQSGKSLTPRGKHQLILADRVNRNGGIGEYPRVLLTNSHDGNAACKLQGGLWRMICSNGIVISDGFIQSAHIRHSHRTIEEVVQAAQGLRAQADKIGEHVAEFKAFNLSPAAAVEFARLALKQRFENAPGRVVDPEAILTLQRDEDAGNSLWNVFNVTQEWLLKGGFPYQTKNGSNRRARPIKSIDESGRLNTALWDLAETFRPQH